MKKFSVLFVAMLIVLMLFVGCKNEPKERAATTEEARLVNIFKVCISTVDLETPPAMRRMQFYPLNRCTFG